MTNTTTISRRQFAHLLGVGAAAALVRPTISFSAHVPNSTNGSAIIRLSANENPYGPSTKAMASMTNAFHVACRYPDEHAQALVDALAKLNGVSSEEILIGDGSSEILKLCAETFTGPELGKLVAADPTFEALLNYS